MATLIHEVQHDADLHLMLPEEQYLSELRAYWIDGGQFADCSVESGSAVKGDKAGNHSLDGFDNERQQRIFKHLYASYQDFVPQLWETQHGRDMILQHKRPTGINMINSTRIDQLHSGLKSLAASMTTSFNGSPDGKKDPALDQRILDQKKRVESMIGNLLPTDTSALASEEMKSVWVSTIDAYFHMERDYRDMLKKQLGLA